MRQQSSVMTLDTNDMEDPITSEGISLISIYAYSIQGVWSGGTAMGTFTLEGSNDPGDNGSGQGVSQPVNWTLIDGSSKAISGSPGSILYDVTQCSYRWVRLVYTPSSGIGATLSCTINTKGV